MNIRNLKILIRIVDEGCSFTKAAITMDMTQPAVSQAVKEIEKQYNIKLFEKIGRSLTLTEGGKAFAASARKAIDILDEMERNTTGWDEEGILRVGTSITIGTCFLPSFVKEFHNRYPKMEIHALINQSGILEEGLLKNTLDIVLMEGIPRSNALISEEFLDDKLVPICSSSGPFKDGEVIEPAIFRKCRFLLREQGSGTRTIFDRETERIGFRVEPIWESVSTAAIVKAVMEDIGISVLPYRLIEQAYKNGFISIFSVKGMDFSRRLRIVYHKDKTIRGGIEEFINLVKEIS